MWYERSDPTGPDSDECPRKPISLGQRDPEVELRIYGTPRDWDQRVVAHDQLRDRLREIFESQVGGREHAESFAEFLGLRLAVEKSNGFVSSRETKVWRHELSRNEAVFAHNKERYWLVIKTIEAMRILGWTEDQIEVLLSLAKEIDDIESCLELSFGGRGSWIMELVAKIMQKHFFGSELSDLDLCDRQVRALTFFHPFRSLVDDPFWGQFFGRLAEMRPNVDWNVDLVVEGREGRVTELREVLELLAGNFGFEFEQGCSNDSNYDFFTINWQDGRVFHIVISPQDIDLRTDNRFLVSTRADAARVELRIIEDEVFYYLQPCDLDELLLDDQIFTFRLEHPFARSVNLDAWSVFDLCQFLVDIARVMRFNGYYPGHDIQVYQSFDFSQDAPISHLNMDMINHGLDVLATTSAEQMRIASPELIEAYSQEMAVNLLPLFLSNPEFFVNIVSSEWDGLDHFLPNINFAAIVTDLKNNRFSLADRMMLPQKEESVSIEAIVYYLIDQNIYSRKDYNLLKEFVEEHEVELSRIDWDQAFRSWEQIGSHYSLVETTSSVGRMTCFLVLLTMFEIRTTNQILIGIKELIES